MKVKTTFTKNGSRGKKKRELHTNIDVESRVRKYVGSRKSVSTVAGSNAGRVLHSGKARGPL